MCDWRRQAAGGSEIACTPALAACVTDAAEEAVAAATDELPEIPMIDFDTPALENLDDLVAAAQAWADDAEAWADDLPDAEAIEAEADACEDAFDACMDAGADPSGCAAELTTCLSGLAAELDLPELP